MTDVTQVLSQIEQGDPSAVEQLLPLVYDELRGLAAARLAAERPGQTLQATALVHDAYIRLVETPRRKIGRVEPTFLRLPLNPCDGSWWRTCAASGATDVGGLGTA